MLSDVVADLIRHHRKRLDLTREQLAERCASLGAQQLTLAALTNIETGRPVSGVRRREISVDELVVIARALDVPPLLLLVDLRNQVAHKHGDEDAWTTMLRLVGRLPDHWMPDALPLRDVLKVVELVDSIEESRVRDGIPAEVLPDQDQAAERRRLFDEGDRARLRHLTFVLGNLSRQQLPIPPISGYVRQRAQELQIELPTAEETKDREGPDQGD